MNKYVVSDPNLCVGCKACEIACVKAHMGPPVEGITRKDFTSRITVVKTEALKGAFTCRHCPDMPCGRVCPSGAIIQAENTIQVLQERCIGCKKCVLACPYGAIHVRKAKVVHHINDVPAGFSFETQAQKCDLCIDSSTGSACVAKCPKKALSLVVHEVS